MDPDRTEKHSSTTATKPSPGNQLLARLTSRTLSGTTLNDTEQSKKRKDESQRRNESYQKLLESGQAENVPIGYPSLEAYISEDIDGRAYRRFASVRNGLLLRYQAKISKIEAELRALDQVDEEKYAQKDIHAISRLQSWRYNENPARDSERKKLFDNIEEALAKYDDLLLREHKIMSIQPCPPNLHKALFDFIFNGKLVPDLKDAQGNLEGKKKHLPGTEYEYLSQNEDFLLLGTQEDAWLITYRRWIKPFIPRRLRKWLLAGKDHRRKNESNPLRVFYSNERTVTFVKIIVGIATTSLLAVPIIILYVMSVTNLSGWLKIGVLLVFTAIFSFLLAALTNARRNEMFAGSAAYCAVLIVFLTYSG